MKTNWLIRSVAVADPENNAGMQMQDIDPNRLSTETQRRNGFRQSNKKDHGERIFEDLRNGAVICPICMDEVHPGRTEDTAAWHCHECYAIFHLHCVKSWEESSSRGIAPDTVRRFVGISNWKCPNCSFEMDEKPKAKCWGGHTNPVFAGLESERPNACNELCGRRGHCPHWVWKSCEKRCHPGRCTLPCDGSCPSIVLPKDPTAWGRFKERVRKRKPGILRTLLFASLALVISYTMLGIWCHKHLQFWNMPYKYPTFRDFESLKESFVVTFGVIAAQVVNTILILGLLLTTRDFLVGIFNLDSVPFSATRDGIKKLGGGLMILFSFAVWLTPLIAFSDSGSQLVWYNQMKDSCSGMPLRVKVDIWLGSDADQGAIPLTKFMFQNLENKSIPNAVFYLASHAEPVSNGTDFQYFQRISGGTNDTYLGVDVDITNGLWRYYKLNQTDDLTAWLADGFKHPNDKLLPKPPLFNRPSSILLQSGSFDDTYKTLSKHLNLHISNQNILIPNFNMFLQQCDQEPFLRAFKYNRFSEKRRLVNSEWEARNEQGEVLRTASFGHGRQALDVCLRTDGGLTDVNEVAEWLVPFAVVAAWRQRIYDTKLRSMICV